MGKFIDFQHERMACENIVISYNRPSEVVRVAISASESSDITAFGLSKGHLDDILAKLALHLLAANMDIFYGGDLRRHGITELLFELVMRYTRSEDLGKRTRITHHLAWPVHIAMPIKRIECLSAELSGMAETVCLGIDGNPMTLQTRRRLSTQVPTKDDWSKGLTAMRRHQQAGTDARILLGGQVSGYKGCMPGIAEEALHSLRGGQPLYVVGGFGGSARDIAVAMGLAEPPSRTRSEWAGLEKFRAFSDQDLNNGLSREENEMLAATPLIGQSVLLIMCGLHRLWDSRNTVMEEIARA